MRKVIHVYGAGNTGKTTSIRKFLEIRGIFHKRGGDIAAVFPVQKNGRSRVLGVASGGDNIDVVQDNLKFLDEHELDFVVCASRSSGLTYERVEQFAKEVRAIHVPIETGWVEARYVISAAARIAEKIEQNLS